MGSGPVTGLPPGYTVEQPQGSSTLPPGYTIEGQAGAATSTGVSHEQWVQQHPIADLFGFNENSDFIKKADALLGQGSQVTHEDALGALKAHVDKQTNSSAVLKKVLDFNDYLKKAGLPEAADRMTQGLSVALMAGGGGIKPPEAAPPEAESPGIVKQIVKGEKVAREPATQAVGQAAGAAAKGAEVTPKAGGALDSFESAGNAVYSKSKGLYSQIDDATGGKFSGNQKQLENITKQMRGAGSDEELNALQAERSKLLIRQEQLFDEASGKGVDSGTVEQAKQTYRQANALHDVDAQIFQSRVVDSTDSAGRATLVDPKKLLPRLQKLDKSGRLADAFGGDEQAATKFLSDTAQIAKQGQKAAKIQYLARAGAGVLGAGAAVEAVKSVFGEGRQ